MMKKIFFSIIIIACLFPRLVYAFGAASIVEKGNRLYKDQKYEDAVKVYDQALSNQPDSAVINFDAGTAQYKTQEYQKANSSFEKSLITEDKSLEAKANYNLGNSRYMSGLSKENADLSGAVKLLEGALTNYNRTQELFPKDEDAKVNYKIVEKKLKELKEKLKQQPQEDNNSQKQQGEDKQKAEENQAEQARQEEKKTADEQKQSNQAQEQQEQQAAAQSPAQSEEPGRASAQSEEFKQMSKEEANMLLEGYRQEENTAGMLKDDGKGVEEKVSKDW